MPGVTVGVYEGEETAGTEVSSTYEGRHLTVREDELIHTFHADGFVDKGDPVVLCDAGVPTTYGKAVGVAFKSGAATSTMISIDTEGIFNLTVYAENDAGNVAIEIGDELYIRAGTLPGAADGDGTGDAEISKIVDPATQVPFGYALGSMVAGGSGVIAVKVHWDPIAHWLFDDEAMYFGDDQDIKVYWTEEELQFDDIRTLALHGYYRCIHVAATIEMDVTRYAAISTYTVVTGAAAAGIEAFGGKFTLSHEDDKAVTGYFGGVMAEVKNTGDGCDTACALFLRWDNDSVIGFGGVIHSFIRCEDNSGGTAVTNLFELYGMDATVAAAANVIVCQAGAAIVASHVIKISANGVPYWIMMDSTPPA
jgi:hypothetical protein